MHTPPSPTSGLKDPSQSPELSDAQLAERIAQDQKELTERLQRARDAAEGSGESLRKQA